MTSETNTASAPVVRAVLVARSCEDAFRIFTEDIGGWWPMETYSVFGATARVAVEGSDIVEHSAEGERTVWAEIVESDPPRLLVLKWHPGTDPAAATTVEVAFSADGNGTRVELTHAGWEALGERAMEARQSYDGGWLQVLERFAAAG